MTILNTAAPFIANFERYEKKYQMTAFQAAALKPVLESYMKPDQYPTSTNCSLYLDTPDHLLVRRSLQHPDYKEKLRLRSYGTPDDNGIVFLEIKKKTGGIVYKRRISMGAQEAMDYLLNGEKPEKQGQIFREIDWMMQRYHLIPSIMVNYDRISYTELTPSPDSLRITIDRNIRYRDTDLDLRSGDSGTMLLPAGTRIMEIKTARAIPLWLIRAIESLGIHPVSLSKVGTAYQELQNHPSFPLRMAV